MVEVVISGLSSSSSYSGSVPSESTMQTGKGGVARSIKSVGAHYFLKQYVKPIITFASIAVLPYNPTPFVVAAVLITNIALWSASLIFKATPTLEEAQSQLAAVESYLSALKGLEKAADSLHEEAQKVQASAREAASAAAALLPKNAANAGLLAYFNRQQRTDNSGSIGDRMSQIDSVIATYRARAENSTIQAQLNALEQYRADLAKLPLQTPVEQAASAAAALLIKSPVNKELADYFAGEIRFGGRTLISKKISGLENVIGGYRAAVARYVAKPLPTATTNSVPTAIANPIPVAIASPIP